MKQYEGTFKPPMIGRGSVPIKVAGPGTLVTTEDNLIVSGFEPSKLQQKKALILVAFALIFSGVMVGASFLWHDMPIWLKIAAMIGGLVGLVLIARGGSEHSDQPVEFVIPWDRVKSAVWDTKDPGLLLLSVKRHTPKGTIFFCPQNSIQLMLSLRAHGVKTPR